MSTDPRNTPERNIIMESLRVQMEPHMLTNKRLAMTIRENVTPIDRKERVKPRVDLEKKHPTMFVPSQQDKLFWIFYVMTKGFDEYNLHQYTNQFTEEKKLKFAYIDKIREKKALIKSHGIRKIPECESDLINEKAISMKTFHVLCIIENIPFIYFTKNTFYEFAPTMGVANTTIIRRVNDYYTYEINKSELIPMYKANRFEIANYDKPIKAISSFTSEELLVIAKTFKITGVDITGKKKTKQVIYQEIYGLLTENS